MKKYVFSTMAFAAIVALASCNNAAPKMDEQPANEANGSESGIKIAYVEVDSLMTQYDFCKDFTLVLQKKSNNARNTLNQKGQQLQNAMNNFQQKLNNNGFASREQAESQQLAIQRQQNDLQQLQARLENELANETQTYNDGLRDSLQHFLAVYNKQADPAESIMTYINTINSEMDRKREELSRQFYIPSKSSDDDKKDA